MKLRPLKAYLRELSWVMDGRVGRAGWAESATISDFIVSVAMLYVECHRCDLVPDIEEQRAILRWK